MAKKSPTDADLNERRSRFEWQASDIVIIKNPDQEGEGRPESSGAEKPDATPTKTKDDDEEHKEK